MSSLQFAAFGHDDARLGGPEIGPAFLATPEGALKARPIGGDARGLTVGPADLLAPLADGFTVHVRWAMPDFGYLWLQADNGGQLYRLPQTGAAQVWNLNYELARSRILWNAQLELAARSNAVQEPPKPIRQKLAAAAALLHDAMFANQDRRSRLADDALAKALDAGERLLVHLAQATIATEQSRGQGRTLRLAAPVRSLDAQASEPRCPSENAWAELWPQVCDEGTLNFSATELAAGHSDAADRALELLARVGARARGRALLPYLNPPAPMLQPHRGPGGPADDAGQPALAASDDERAAWRQAAVNLARRYRGRIQTWELLPPVPGAALTDAHVRQIVETAEAVKAACPDVELVLTPGEVFAQRMTFLAPPDGRPQARGFMAVIRDCLAATGAIDAVAIALYYPNNDLLQLFRTVDQVADAGRPVHLLAAAAPSQWRDDPQAELSRGRPSSPRGENFSQTLGYWRRPWSPEVQAAYGLGLALLARAHPLVQALEWADFSDAGLHTFPYGGLVSATGEPKPLYHRLAELRRAEFVWQKPWGEEL